MKAAVHRSCGNDAAIVASCVLMRNSKHVPVFQAGSDHRRLPLPIGSHVYAIISGVSAWDTERWQTDVIKPLAQAKANSLKKYGITNKNGATAFNITDMEDGVWHLMQIGNGRPGVRWIDLLHPLRKYSLSGMRAARFPSTALWPSPVHCTVLSSIPRCPCRKFGIEREENRSGFTA